MQQSNITFQNRKLTVDYITFNLRNGTSQIQEIANIFNADYSFDSYLVDQNYKNPSKEPVVVNNEYHQLVFVINSSEHKVSTFLIQFSGENAAYLYNLLKSGKFYWPDFDHFDLVLGRFDINYTREEQVIDDLVFQDFGERCIQKYKARYPQALTEPIFTTGFSLGTRKGDYFLRTYKSGDNSFLKFELEIKKTKARSYHNYFLNLDQTFVQFENLIATRFYPYLRVALVLDTELTDWLVIKLRPLRKQTFSLTDLKIDYIRSGSFQNNIDSYKSCTLLQFLVYAQTLNYKIDSLGTISYRLVQFRVQDFLKYTKLSSNYYQLKKLIEFFDELQTNSLIKFFSNQKYRSLVTIPEVNLQKGKQNSWTVEVWIADELFYYAHPFLLPDLFQVKLTKLQLEVQVHVIRTFSSFDTQKIFYVEEFLQAYPSTLNNQQITSVKRYFIQLMEIFQEHKLIEASYQVLVDDKVYHVDKLLPNNISQGFIVFEKLLV